MRAKRIISGVLVLFLVFGSASAYAWFWPIVAALAEGTVIAARFLAAPVTRTVVALGKTAEANLTVWKIAEATATIGTVSAVLLSTDSAVENSSSTAQAQILVNLNSTNPKRANPDSSTWNDAATGEVDPTPKASDPTISSSNLAPVSGVSVSSGASLSYDSSSNKYILHPAPSVITDSTYSPALCSYCASYKTSTKACSSYVVYTYYKVRRPSATVIDSGAVEVGGLTISNDKFSSSAVSYQVSVVDTDKAIRYIWTRSSLSIPEASSAFYSVKSAGTQVMDDGTVKPIYADDAATAYSDALAQKEAYDSDTSYSIVRSVSTDSSFSAVVRFQDGYAHNVSVASICGSGQVYSVSTGSCVSGDSVTKPATLACEVVYTDGAFQLDSRNPNCETVADRLAVGGNVVHLTSGQGETEIVRNSDGSYSITTNEGGTWKSINTGAYSSGSGGAPISDVTDSSTGSFQYSPTSSSSGGSCGGSGQAPCSIDDSGFSGADETIEGKFSDLSDAEDKDKDGLSKYTENNGGENWGFLPDWFPRLWPEPVTCQNIEVNLDFSVGPLAGQPSSAVIDFCEKAQSVKQFMSWLFYIMGVIYIWRRLTDFGGSK